MSTEQKVLQLESKLKEFERNCCNKALIEKAAREELLLNQVLDKLGQVSAKQDLHQKYFYFAISGLAIFEYLGLGKTITTAVGG